MEDEARDILQTALAQESVEIQSWLTPFVNASSHLAALSWNCRRRTNAGAAEIFQMRNFK
jgi:plasmid stability protein